MRAILPHVAFLLITQKREKLELWHFAAFSNILLDTFVPNMVLPTCTSLQILGKIQMGVFPNSGFLAKSLIKENFHNSRTSHDIDMKLGPVTKIYKKNKTTSKNLDDVVMSKNCDVIVIFSIYGQFRAMRKPDSRCRVKTYVFINSNLLPYRNEKQN